MHSITLTPSAPYSFAHTAHAARFLYIAMQPMPDGSLRRAVRIGEYVALLALHDIGTADAPGVRVDLLAADGPIAPEAFAAKARALLNPAVDLAGLEAAHGLDGHLAGSLARLRGLSALGSDTLFEAVGLTLIEQQISVKMAQAGERWLMDYFDDGITADGVRWRTFPSPARIAAASVAELSPMKITRIRIGRLIDLARHIVETGGAFESLRSGPIDALYAGLRAHKGIGHWTAAWSMIRAVGHFPYFGAADVALRNAVNRLCFGAPGRIDPAALDALMARYGEYAGLASYYFMMHYEMDREREGV